MPTGPCGPTGPVFPGKPWNNHEWQNILKISSRVTIYMRAKKTYNHKHTLSPSGPGLPIGPSRPSGPCQSKQNFSRGLTIYLSIYAHWLGKINSSACNWMLIWSKGCIFWSKYSKTIILIHIMNNIINHKLLIILLNECFLFEYISDCNLLLQWKKLNIFPSLFHFFGLLLLNIFLCGNWPILQNSLMNIKFKRTSLIWNRFFVCKFNSHYCHFWLV